MAAASASLIPIFDPGRTRKSLIDLFEAGYMLDDRYDPTRPMGNVAAMQLSGVVEAMLVGLEPRVAVLMAERIRWIDLALASDERCGSSRAFHRTMLLSAKAIYLWLDHAELAAPVWRSALDAHEESMLAPGAYVATKTTYALDDFMAMSLLADQPERGLKMYECLRRGKPCPTLPRVSQPRNWGWWACKQVLGEPVDDAALLAAGRRFLRLNLDDPWLGRGQAFKAAMWLMVVYWLHDRSLTPQQTLMKAYDDLPGVTSPQEALP